MLRAIAFISVAMFASSTALAADNGIYLGAAVSKSKLDFEESGISADDDVTKYKVIAGIRPLDWLAAEVNYVDFGTFESQITPTQHADYRLKGIDVFVVGLWEIGLVDFFAKAGAVSFDREIQLNNVSIPDDDDSGVEPAFGGGIQVHLGSLSVRGEFEKFEIADDTDVDMISLGVTWTFL